MLLVAWPFQPRSVRLVVLVTSISAGTRPNNREQPCEGFVHVTICTLVVLGSHVSQACIYTRQAVELGRIICDALFCFTSIIEPVVFEHKTMLSPSI